MSNDDLVDRILGAQSPLAPLIVNVTALRKPA